MKRRGENWELQIPFDYTRGGPRCARGAVSIKNKKKITFRRLISNSDVDYYYYFLVFFLLLLLFFNHFNFSPPSSRIKLQSHYHHYDGGGCGGGGGGGDGDGGRARRRQDSVSRASTNRPRVEHFSPSKTR